MPARNAEIEMISFLISYLLSMSYENNSYLWVLLEHNVDYKSRENLKYL